MMLWLLRFDYRGAVTIAFISSGTQFEVAIATDTVVFRGFSPKNFLFRRRDFSVGDLVLEN